jgi:hypothetical protein
LLNKERRFGADLSDHCPRSGRIQPFVIALKRMLERPIYFWQEMFDDWRLSLQHRPLPIQVLALVRPLESAFRTLLRCGEGAQLPLSAARVVDLRAVVPTLSKAKADAYFRPSVDVFNEIAVYVASVGRPSPVIGWLSYFVLCYCGEK